MDGLGFGCFRTVPGIEPKDLDQNLKIKRCKQGLVRLKLTEPWLDHDWNLVKKRRVGMDSEDDDDTVLSEDEEEIALGSEINSIVDSVKTLEKEEEEAKKKQKKASKRASAAVVDDDEEEVGDDDEIRDFDKENQLLKAREKVFRSKLRLRMREKRLKKFKHLRSLLGGVLAHEPWTAEETEFLKIKDPAITGDSAALQAALNRNNTAHMVQCFAEVYIQEHGPTKMFILRAEGGELVGFIAGGPGRTPDAFDEETLEVYAFHVLPAYAHFAEFHKLLWRAMSLWAQRVAWKVKEGEESKKYTKAACLLYEYHPAVLRFFCKHPTMKLHADHPQLDDLKTQSLPHRCYLWELKDVKRIEPWEISQTEHSLCMKQFLEKSGMVTLLKLLTEQSGFDPVKNFEYVPLFGGLRRFC